MHVLYPFAHVFPESGGFLQGMAHPVMGVDHLLAILAVGILSLWQQPRVSRVLPVTFVLAMAAGAAAGFLGWLSEPLELLIAGSVLLLGMLLAVPRLQRRGLLFTVTAAAAWVHGHAHGLEGPEAGRAAYAAGFLAGTSLLLAAGILVGLICTELRQGRRIQQVLGAGATLAGLVFLFA